MIAELGLMAGLAVSKTNFPDYTKNYQAYVSAKETCDSEYGTLDGLNCIIPPPPVAFIGSEGWSAPYGNCVDLAKAYGKNQPGDPISWTPTTTIPFIGAAVLFYFNHVAIVSGVHADGSFDVIQLNCPSCQVRWSPSDVRGFF